MQLPLNAIVNSWTEQTIPKKWEIVRERWEVGHRVRTLLTLVAFTAAVVGLLMVRS